jgi:thiol-disulfide isomerase/thioredoxin
MLSVNSTRAVTLHYTDWCPACQRMKPVWEQVKAAASGSGVRFAEVDEDQAKTPGVTGYPTIRMVLESGRTVEYTGGADFERLRSWVVSPAH